MPQHYSFRSLNTGAGDLTYGLELSVHLDFSIGSLLAAKRSVVSDVENLCVASDSIDLLVCVGSVINYVAPEIALNEFSRVLRPGGILILEYERSHQLEFEPVNSKLIETNYKGQPHPIWLYSEKLIDELLYKNGFCERKKLHFHAIPEFLHAVSFCELLSTYIDRMDMAIAKRINALAANCIGSYYKR
jgi:SAM-dependent methyltransferase